MSRYSIAAVLLALAAPAIAADWSAARWTGTLSCASASCHGRAEPLHNPGSTQRQEYLHFLGGDPHARAAQRLCEPRYRNVLAQLAPDEPPQQVHLTRCANCHDPLGQASAAQDAPLGRGIGCESCHGPARDWIAIHYERGVSRSRLSQLGMVDTKHVLTRARACAACHVGGADSDVNHDLYAAGHPPLLFEMASHQASIERKHWDDAPRRRAQPNYEVELWAAGRIASAEAALKLLASRAEQAARDKAPWPEFAESNCASCHQPLLAAGNSRGIAAWQSWNVLFSGELLPRVKSPLASLRAEMESSLVPSPSQIARLAAAARAAILLQPDILRLDASSALGALPLAGEEFTFDRACHELAAILAAERALFDAGRTPTSGRDGLRRVAAALRLLDTASHSPAERRAALEHLAAELEQVRQDLANAASKP